nr:hypothetical protein [Deinococcus peraridilitoris]
MKLVSRFGTFTLVAVQTRQDDVVEIVCASASFWRAVVNGRSGQPGEIEWPLAVVAKPLLPSGDHDQVPALVGPGRSRSTFLRTNHLCSVAPDSRFGRYSAISAPLRLLLTILVTPSLVVFPLGFFLVLAPIGSTGMVEFRIVVIPGAGGCSRGRLTTRNAGGAEGRPSRFLLFLIEMLGCRRKRLPTLSAQLQRKI